MAKTLTIEGADSTAAFEGNASGGSSAFSIETAVPITVKNLTITKGSAGISMNAAGGELTLGTGALVKENTVSAGASGDGPGIHVYSGSLTLQGSAEISGKIYLRANPKKPITIGGVLTKYNASNKITICLENSGSSDATSWQTGDQVITGEADIINSEWGKFSVSVISTSGGESSFSINATGKMN